ncbi:MAG: acyl-CoA carboxylase subunit beta [Planctomycetota bacterium]|nr:acyl-CoA carboxylase subunit beta [Planctomycetota bacterium]
MNEEIKRLEDRRETVRKMGPPKRIEVQRARGKWTVRERIDRLYDPGTFEELGILGRSQDEGAAMAGRETPADGVVTGVGQVEGREVFVIAYDFSVLAGSIGLTGEKKAARVRQLANRFGKPIVWLVDSAGARIQEIASTHAFADSGSLFYEQVQMSGRIPMVAAMMGPGAAGTAYIPALSDFVPMVQGTSFMALGGPPLVKAIVGEDVTEEELGGSSVHTKISGVADLEVPDDEACLDAIRTYLSFFPSSCQEAPPIRAGGAPMEGADQAILDALPSNPRMAYDMKVVLRAVVDEGDLFEIKPQFARNLITSLARIGGRPVGILASQPSILAGAIDIDASDKAARFMNLCDAFGIPLVFFQDVPGFMVGTQAEQAGIIRHGAKMLFALSEATVPKVTVVVGKAYGAGYYVMCGKAYGPDRIVAWPNAQISLMGAAGAVNIIFRQQIQAAEDSQAERTKLEKEFGDKIGAYPAAEAGLIDDIIDPRETRATILRTLQLAETKTVPRPQKKRGVRPV